MEVGALRRQASFSSVPNKLPRYLTSFVGRRTELLGLKSVLRGSRLVTLTGPGGAGQRRLAAERARASRHRWPRGVRWGGLAPVRGPGQPARAPVRRRE